MSEREKMAIHILHIPQIALFIFSGLLAIITLWLGINTMGNNMQNIDSAASVYPETISGIIMTMGGMFTAIFAFIVFLFLTSAIIETALLIVAKRKYTKTIFRVCVGICQGINLCYTILMFNNVPNMNLSAIGWLICGMLFLLPAVISIYCTYSAGN